MVDDEREESPWLLLCSRCTRFFSVFFACALAALLSLLPPFLGGGI